MASTSAVKIVIKSIQSLDGGVKRFGMDVMPEELANYAEDMDNVLYTANTAKSTAESAQSTANTAKSTAESIAPDWNQNDESSRNYVKNRTHYAIPEQLSNVTTLVTNAKMKIDGANAAQGVYHDNIIGAVITDYNGKEYRIQPSDIIPTGFNKISAVFHDTLDAVMLIIADLNGNAMGNAKFRRSVDEDQHEIEVNFATAGIYYNVAYCKKSCFLNKL